MPNHKSAEKRVRQTEKRRLRNKTILSAMRTQIKRVRTAIDSSDASAAAEALPAAVRALSRAANKGAIHRNQARRKIGRLTAAVTRLKG